VKYLKKIAPWAIAIVLGVIFFVWLKKRSKNKTVAPQIYQQPLFTAMGGAGSSNFTNPNNTYTPGPNDGQPIDDTANLVSVRSSGFHLTVKQPVETYPNLVDNPTPDWYNGTGK
jgi:hypothetical protein